MSNIRSSIAALLSGCVANGHVALLFGSRVVCDPTSSPTAVLTGADLEVIRSVEESRITTSLCNALSVGGSKANSHRKNENIRDSLDMDDVLLQVGMFVGAFSANNIRYDPMAHLTAIGFGSGSAFVTEVYPEGDVSGFSKHAIIIIPD